MAKSTWGSRPKEEYERKLVGIVKIVTGKSKAKLVLQEEGKTFKNGTDEIVVELGSLPKRPHLTPEDKSGKEYRVRMSQDGSEVEALTPVRGHFPAKLVDLGPRPEKDSDPEPKEKVFDEGGPKEDRHLEFFAVYEITSGPFKGVQLPAYWLHYKFEADEEGYTRFAGNFENKRATRLFQLRDWIQAHGLDSQKIEWDEDGNILPLLLERALENDREVEINMANGYILKEGGVIPADGYEEPEDVEDIEEVQAKAHSAGKRNGHKEEPVDSLDEDFPLKKVAKPASKLVKASKVKRSHADEDDDL